jgi:CIC family chloride channel protein
MAAVFAGAARIPIATLLMITEMTGGYQLLVPAALAIMVAYIVQRQFSLGRRYPTLYEGQVVGRPDSPTHQIEHLETAIHLLAKRKVNIPGTIRHLNLRTLIDAGIPVDLPENRRLLIGTIRKGSDCIGKQATVCFPPENDAETDLVGIFRAAKLLFPDAKPHIRADDRLLLIITAEAWEKQKQHFSG